jgi:hypothetical protein
MAFRSSLAAVIGMAAVTLTASEIPRPTGNFSVDLPNGQKLPLSQYRGKVIGLAFISTT